MTRNLAMAGVLGAAIGGPYVVDQAPSWTEGWSLPFPTSTQPANQPPQPQQFDVSQLTPPSAEAPKGPGSEIYQRPAPFEGRIHHSLDEILRWEVTKDWVFRSWDRKSTGLALPELFGVRVPVVTGQGMPDIAGALSYYFDAQGRLQKIRLNGTTADTNGIVRLVAGRFGLQRRVSPSPGDQLYQLEQEGRVRSQLRTHPEPVLWGTSPHSSFRIDLELNRPGTAFWYSAPQSRLDIPNTAANRANQSADPTAQASEEPVFPPRNVVPDGTSSQSNTAAQAASTPGTQSSAAAGDPQIVQQAPSDIAPLDGYRDRFRWPD